MKLQEILQLTKVGKKTVYFYIKEGMIHPVRNIENRYYEFSKEDLEQLKRIISLRSIGMSIQDIKDLFAYPTLTNFFIHRQIHGLKERLQDTIHQLQVTYQLVEEIPANATPENLQPFFERLESTNVTNNLVFETYFPNIDSRMIAILICAPFMDIKGSEYHDFLWDRISNELKIQLDGNLSYLKQLIYRLTPEQIQCSSIEQYILSKRIANMKEEEVPFYEEDFYHQCMGVMNDTQLQRYWKLLYEPILVPYMQFFQGKARMLLSKYNPDYETYHNKIHLIAKRVCNRMKEEGKLSIELFDCSHLICMYTFPMSMFTQIKLEEIKKFIP